MPDQFDKQTKLLAAIAYGESSTADDANEMFAIASVLVRQRDVRGYSDMATFLGSDKSFSFAVNDGNKRYAKLVNATEADIARSPAMTSAMAAAINALNNGADHSNGAYFWDGADIKTNYRHHFKVRHGIKITDPAHNIYGLADSTNIVIKYDIRKVKAKGANHAAVRTVKKEVGRYDHVYDSTAAHGGTIFWKFSPEYLAVTKAKEYK